MDLGSDAMFMPILRGRTPWFNRADDVLTAPVGQTVALDEIAKSGELSPNCSWTVPVGPWPLLGDDELRLPSASSNFELPLLMFGVPGFGFLFCR